MNLISLYCLIFVNLTLFGCKAEEYAPSNNDFVDKGFNYDNHKCLDKENGKAYYIGEAFSKQGKCVRVQCLPNLQLWENDCLVPPLDGDCVEIPGDNSKLYPKCCPTYECRRVLNHGNYQEKRVFDQYGNLISSSVTQLFVISENY